MTARQERAERAPLKMVPGQMLGEKRTEEAAVNKAPMARPPFLFDLSESGLTKRTRPAVAAMERVERVMESAETGGEMDRSIEAATVMMERRIPAYSVVAISNGEAVSGDEDAPLDGNGGCRKAIERARAMYPVDRW